MMRIPAGSSKEAPLVVLEKAGEKNDKVPHSGRTRVADLYQAYMPA